MTATLLLILLVPFRNSKARIVYIYSASLLYNTFITYLAPFSVFCSCGIITVFTRCEMDNR